MGRRGASEGLGESLLGMMEVFCVLAFHYSRTVMTRDFLCVGSGLGVCDFQEFWQESGGACMGRT